MTIVLSEVTFENDFFSSTMPDGSTLVLNRIDESMKHDDGSIALNSITILVIDAETGDNILCSPVIGLGNDRLVLSTEYEEYLGKVLNEDNMQYCTIEIPEEEDE